MSSRNATRSSADEETPLLGRNGSTGGKSDNMGTVQRFKRHMNCDVTKNWADLVLLFCYIITGLLDSSAVFIWGSFVSMQTAALIATVGKDTKEGLHWQMLVPLASVAFQSSGQAVTSRALKYNGLTSVVLTSNYCDLFSDPQLFKLSNVERNRRIGAPAMLLLGACIGGLYAHSSVGLAGALWTACGLKLLAVFAWVFWPSEILEE
ncbi:unnamed protein product [Alternaria alternata]